MLKRTFIILATIVMTVAPSFAQFTKLQEALMLGDLKQIKQMIDKDPKLVNQKDQGGMTPLFTAIMMGHKDIVQALVEAGADVNASGEGGTTPLVAAMISDNKDMVRYLISKGADPQKKVQDDMTVIDLARMYQKPEMVKLLGGKYEEPPTSVYSYAPKPKPRPADDSPAPASKRPPFERKAGSPGTKAVTYLSKTVNGCPVNVITIDLKDSRVKLGAAITQGGIGTDEPFSSFISRTKPTAAINATFFSKGDLKPIGDIVIDGKLVNYGGMGTGICITDDCRVEFIEAVRAHHTDWSAFRTVICCGPHLLKDGKKVLDPQGEGFRDPHVLGRANRTGIGITPGNKLVMANTKKGVSLSEWAGVMKSLGCTDAINFDGGASMGMYYRGRTISTPGRRLTNVLLVWE